MSTTSTAPLTATVHPLAYVRAERGWSQRRLARLVQRLARDRRLNLATGANRVWRWEHYGTTPDERTQLLLAELLDVPTAMVTARPWPRWLPAWDDLRFVFPWSREGAVEALAEASDRLYADRRGFVGLTGLDLAALAHEWRLREPERLREGLDGKHVDPELVHWVDVRTQHLRRLDDSLGGGALRQLAAEELGLVTGLLRHGAYTADVSRQLFATAAELAQLAGWASFDSGFHGPAQRYYVTALHAAHAAGEQALGAYVLGCMSYQLVHVGRPHDAIGLALSALEGGGDNATGRAGALARLRVAHAQGAGADTGACHRALAAADDTDIESAATPGWLYWLDAAHVRALRSRCLITLGTPDRAAATLEHAIQAEHPAFNRDAAVHLTWLAEAYLSSHDLERSCDAITRALRAAENLHSARSMGLVRAFRHKLAPHAGEPAVRETVQMLTRARGTAVRAG